MAASPPPPPVQGEDGNFYGMTSAKGDTSLCTVQYGGCGVIYKITPAGEYSVLYTFDQTNGANPYGPLLLGTNGNFYGTTFYGGSVNGVYNGNGVFFRITPAGVYTPLYTFCSETACLDGGQPAGGLVQGTDGNFYGTTTCCGAHLNSGFFGGTFFKITPAGQLTVLYNFCNQTNCDDGGQAGGLIQATDGNFYGTAEAGGANGDGTIFQLTPQGVLTVMHAFDYTDGRDSVNQLTQGTNGILYGQTDQGGTGPCINSGCGAVFSLDNSLPTYANPVTWFGVEGATIEILGSDLDGTTEVTFNGISATFNVVSNNYLTTVVPSGATLGVIKLTTHKGVLTSKQSFHVLPKISSFTPTSGPVGTSVTITGTGLTQTTRVDFGNTVSATFTVVSDTEVTATVPTGAKTGKITLTTKSGTATSSKTYTVTK